MVGTTTDKPPPCATVNTGTRTADTAKSRRETRNGRHRRAKGQHTRRDSRHANSQLDNSPTDKPARRRASSTHATGRSAQQPTVDTTPRNGRDSRRAKGQHMRPGRSTRRRRSSVNSTTDKPARHREPSPRPTGRSTYQRLVDTEAREQMNTGTQKVNTRAAAADTPRTANSTTDKPARHREQSRRPTGRSTFQRIVDTKPRAVNTGTRKVNTHAAAADTPRTANSTTDKPARHRGRSTRQRRWSTQARKGQHTRRDSRHAGCWATSRLRMLACRLLADRLLPSATGPTNFRRVDLSRTTQQTNQLAGLLVEFVVLGFARRRYGSASPAGWAPFASRATSASASRPWPAAPRSASSPPARCRRRRPASA